ncbi:hypothetical protein LP419_26315 [Massilia sp. H-1]|nr:hypothetical protein LP419_26315 [Massilia sp. H-1]
MRTLSLLLPASLLLLCSTVSAQSASYPQTDEGPISTVQVSAPIKTVLLRAEQGREIAGSYAMSNGWMLKVRPSSRFIDATIDRQKPMRLLAVSADKFVSNDGSVTMEFNKGDRNDEMTMSYTDPSIAQVVVISSLIAQR